MPGSLFNLRRYLKKGSSDSQDAGEDQQAVAQTLDTPVQSQRMQTASTQSVTAEDTAVATKTTASTTVQNPPSAQAATVQVKKEEKTVESSSTEQTQPDDQFQKRAGMDVLSRLTQRSNKALLAGVNKAKEYQAKFVDTEFVLWGLLQDASVYQLISELKITPTELVKEVEAKLQKGNNRESPKFSPRVKKVLELSFPEARRLGYEFISPEHILLGLIKEGEGLAAQILSKFGLTAEKLQQKVTGKEEKEEKKEVSASSEFATDLTQLAREGKLDPVVARSREIERIMHILSRRTKNNPVLIGDAGVGKTAIVEGLAQRIVSGNVPETLTNRRILSLDLTSLLAGASHRGEFEKRLQKLITEVKSSQGQIILFVDEIHNMVGAGGGEGTMDASNILKPSLARGELQTIGTTTITEYRKYIEKDRALERRFQPVMVPEPTKDEAIEMVRALKDKYEAFHKVAISDKSIEAAVKLSSRYIGDRFLPDKAVDLVDEAASSIRLPAISLPEEIRTLEEKVKRDEAEKDEAAKQGNIVRQRSLEREIAQITKELEVKRAQHEVKKGTSTSEVTPEVIQEIVSKWTGIPISRLTESESEKLVSLEEIIHKKLIDQEEAVAAIAEAVRRGRSGLSSRKRPIGSFIFMGPTGVGKTELAKVLAEELFGSEDMMVRLDMTEYMEKHEVAKLIGAPPGYVGYEEGGQLTEAVRRKPYSVVLLDEIEKANPDVFNILLQILDDGRLTDNKGRTISFRNTILICTSNIGTGLIQQSLLEGMTVGPLNVPKKQKDTITTYAITPTGRELVTRGNTLWRRESAVNNQPTSGWLQQSLTDYFAGQKLLGMDVLTPQQKFPLDGFDTHVVFPSGEEMITRGDRLWRRKSTTAKEWESVTLLDYTKDQTVANAAPDKPDEQLPTAVWKTHTITPAEKEIISMGGRLWMRENMRDTNWKTMPLADYMKDEKIQQPQSQKNEQAPNKSPEVLPKELDVHVFTPSGHELAVTGSTYWVRKTGGTWQPGKLAQLLAGENAPVSSTQEEKPQEDRAFEAKFAQLTEKLLEELRKFFKPELLNRFDEVIVFRPLTANHMLAIVGLQLAVLTKNLEEQNLGFEISDRVKEELTVIGFDPIYGARPLRRTIQRLIENPISTMMIQGNVKEGDVIVVEFDSKTNDFVFSTRHIQPAADVQVEKKQLKTEEQQNSQTPPPVPAEPSQDAGVRLDKKTEEAEKLTEAMSQSSDTASSVPAPAEPAAPSPEPPSPVTPPASNGSVAAVPHFNDFYANQPASTTPSPAPVTS